jgi:hypothetical protein
MEPKLIGIDSLAQQVANVLSQCDVDYLTEIANQVLANQKVEYVGDNMFKVTRTDLEEE